MESKNNMSQENTKPLCINPLCIKPWTELHVWETCATFCCWAKPFAKYPSYQPSQWIWNNRTLNNLREKMVNEGVKAVCPDCSLCINGIDQSIESHKAQYKALDAPGMTDEIRQRILTGKAPYPLTAFISVGRKCNNRCKMCWLRQHEQRKEDIQTVMPYSTILSLRPILDGTRHVEFSGGDLFALDDTDIDVFLTVSNTAEFAAITNGQGITDARIDKYINSNKIKYLKVSLETVQPQQYRHHCGRPIGSLLDRLQRLNGHNVSWYSVVVTAWTLPGLPELIDFAKATNVKTVIIKPYVGETLDIIGYDYFNPFGKGYSEKVHEKALEIFAETAKRAKLHGINIDGLELCKKRLEKRKWDKTIK